MAYETIRISLNMDLERDEVIFKELSVMNGRIRNEYIKQLLHKAVTNISTSAIIDGEVIYKKLHGASEAK